MRKQQKQISEKNSSLFEEGFFVGVDALQKDTYKCATCLDAMHARGYTVGREQDFVDGWKFALQSNK